MAKERVIELLGEEQLLLPELVTAALAANDRIKYRLALLQAARAAAEGDGGAGTLSAERMACGIDDATLDRAVVEAAREDGGYRIPGCGRLVGQAIAEVATMLAPLRTAADPAAPVLEHRLQALVPELPAGMDVLTGADLARLCAGPGGGGDSLHLVVMDAHRALNALAGRIAPESIDGARAYEIDPSRRELVRAFMRGVHATERLKFDHPGLGTLAMLSGETLVIQNDLGTTDAHVLVLKVTASTVTITYTDVHLERLLFFQDLLAPWPVEWEDTRSRSDRTIEGGLFHLATGRFTATADSDLPRFLEHLGSRLVFIIDWNRARKRLRRLVGGRAAIELLRWAAEHDHGHMAFLRAGGDALVYAALDFAGAPAARAGESLRDVLGADAAQRYLQAVLRICADGLLSGKTVSFIQDEAGAELTGYLRSARQEVQDLAVRQAELGVEIAEAARDALEQAMGAAPERCRATAARAKEGEREADALVTEARMAVSHAPDLEPMLALIQAADDISDCAEEAAFYATLLPAGRPCGEVRRHVRRIARLVLTAARDYLRAIELSAELRRGGPREDMDAFLAAVHRAIELERETDDAQRAVHQALAAEATDAGAALFVIVELTRSFEEAADALMHGAHLLRDLTLARVVRAETTARRPTPSAATPSPDTPRSEHVYVIGDTARPIPDAEAIGGKAYGLARLARTGLRVPAAAVLKTSLWREWQRADNGAGADAIHEGVQSAVAALCAQTGLDLGSRRRPLLLSVRSGAPVSMPGMLETVLNVGLSEIAVKGLIAQTGNPKLAWDSYRRLIESHAAVVHGADHEPFAHALRERLAAAGVDAPRELSVRGLRELTLDYQNLYVELTGRPFPQDPQEQLMTAVEAVLRSWDSSRARSYRRMHAIPERLGTAVILQRMVFGNAGGVSGAGVGFTRDPALGDHRLYMDFAFDAQGEDIVGGRHTVSGTAELAIAAPELGAELEQVGARLEAEFGDVQEFEVTVQEGELFLLQTRTAKRTPWAALKIATDQVSEGAISPRIALEHLEALDLTAISRIHVRAPEAVAALASAIPASTGVAIGPVALDREAAERMARSGTPPILVRADTVTDDIAAVSIAAGVLTGAGGRTSHAAVVARELGKPCLVGCGELELDLASRTARFGPQVVGEGDVICIDAEAGMVYAGAPAIVVERPTDALRAVAQWRAAAVTDGE